MVFTARRTAALLVIVGGAVVIYKVAVAGYSLSSIVPVVTYEVRTLIRFEGHDETVRVSTFLPVSDDRQSITGESFTAGDLVADERMESPNRRVTWTAPAVRGPRSVAIVYRVSSHAVRFEIPPGLPIPAPPAELEADLRATESVQVDDPEILALLDRLTPAPRTLDSTLRAIFAFTHDEIVEAPFKGTTDALTALRLREGSCNGKSRLFAALARRAGIPTRLVGGLILGPGDKRTSHQWVESWMNGVWVPFCPLNGHFAEIPARYLRLYTRDEALFTHSGNINFDYGFSVRRSLASRYGLGEGATAPPWASGRLWSLLSEIGIPLDLLKIIVMLPLGATVTVIFRNVVGLRVFGTFLPALIAVACRGTGLFWGLLGFALVLAVVGLARVFLDRMNLLHTPKLTVMLTLVILVMIALAAGSASFGLRSLAYVSLFPIAVTTLTTERFALTVEEEGWREAFSVSAQTSAVVSACYLVMESTALQAVFLAFPELLLVVLAMDLWLGRWMGLRLTEYRRFRGLFRGGARA
jgi:transglutaminase-like putative cysteine protease